MFSKLLDVLNDLQPRQLVLLAGGIAVLMFGIIYFTLSTISQSAQERVEEKPVVHVSEVDERNVVVAKVDIPRKALIQESMLQMKKVPIDAVPKGAVFDVGYAVGQPAISEIYAGDVITESKIYTDRSKAGFVGSIPEDCRAVSVGVDDITGVAGFAKPGDYVDVILREKNDQGATSRLLLQNVLLLGINQDMGGQTSESSAKAADKPAIATVALSPDDVLELVSASALGDIYLALRPFRPSEKSLPHLSYTMRALHPAHTVQTQPTVPASVPVAPAASPPPAYPAEESSSSGIEMIVGDKIITK